MDPITYNLSAGERTSDAFYSTLAEFTSRFLFEAGQRLGEPVDAYLSWLVRAGREPEQPPLRSRDEYLLELLYLGVLWRGYARRAMQAGRPTLFRAIARVKVGHRQMAGLLLSGPGRPQAPLPPSLPALDALLAWLHISGTYAEAAERLTVWRHFWGEMDARQAADQIQAAIDLGGWFETAALDALGSFTPHVENFLKTSFASYRGRRDAILCGSSRAEYHLGMVGTEVLNRAFLESFRAAPRKLVLLPPCMAAKGDDCQAEQTSLGAACTGCTPTCQVHQASQMGKKHGFGVFILPDDLRVFSGSQPGTDGGTPPAGVAVVGISCVLTNTSGGWELRKLGVPAQGLFLDICGCSWHWHPTGIATRTNLRRLLELAADGGREHLPDKE